MDLLKDRGNNEVTKIKKNFKYYKRKYLNKIQIMIYYSVLKEFFIVFCIIKAIFF